MRPDPKAASRLLEDGKDGTCLMFLRTDLRIRLIHALTHSASRERDKKRKSILLVLIPYLWEKFLLHCPFWERLWQQQIHRALVEVSNESTLPDRMVNNRKNYHAHRFDTPVHFRIPTNPVFERMVWTPANENSKAAQLPNGGEAGCLGRFETVPKESVKVDQHCQEFFPSIKSGVIWFAISSDQSFKTTFARSF